MRASITILALLAIPGSNASSASAQESPVPGEIHPSEGWDFFSGEWGKERVFYADQDRDGRIDYRRAPTPCGSFNHVIWFDRDGDGFFDADTTDREPIRVPTLPRPMLTRETGERAPCSLWSGFPSTPHVLAAALTPELLTENDFRHFRSCTRSLLRVATRSDSIRTEPSGPKIFGTCVGGFPRTVRS